MFAALARTRAALTRTTGVFTHTPARITRTTRTFTHIAAMPLRFAASLLLASTVLTVMTGCDSNAPTSADYAMAHPLRFALTSNLSAGEGAVVEVLVTYLRPTGTTVTIAHDSTVIGASGTGATLPVTADVAGCLSDAAKSGTTCTVSLTMRLKRAGRTLDESVQQFPILASTQTVQVPSIDLFEVATVTITPASLSNVEVGDTQTLSASAVDRNGTALTGRNTTWSVVSGNVTVSATGALTVVGTGDARIRATIGGRTSELTITVGAPTVATLTLTPLDTLIAVGGSTTYVGSARSAAGTIVPLTTLTLTSSNPAVATISNLTATAVAIGTTTITARTTQGRGGATITSTSTLRVEVAPPILVDRASVALDSVAQSAVGNTTAVAVTTSANHSIKNLRETITFAPDVQPWLSATINPATTPSTLTLQAAPGALAVGDYAADVRLTSSTDPHQPATVHVTLHVIAARRVVLGQKTINLGSFDATQTSAPPSVVTVNSSSSGVIAGLAARIEYIGTASGWLTTALGANSAPPTTTLTLTPKPLGLAEGTYSARVIVTSTTPGTGPDTTVASLTIAPPIIVDRTTVVLDSIAPNSTGASTNVAVTTSAGRSLSNLRATVTYTPNVAPWLTTTFTSATTPSTLMLQANSGALAAGDYAADVRVTSATDPNQPATVHVTLRVVAARRVVLTPKTVNLGSFDPTLATGTSTIVAVASSTGSAIAGLSAKIEYIGTATGWLATAFGATSAPPSTTLTLTPKPLGLAVGSYSARVIVSSTTLGAGPDTVVATMAVASTAIRWTQVVAGPSHTCAITTAALLYCWGDNGSGKLGTADASSLRSAPRAVTGGLTFSAVALGYYHTCALTTAGKAYCWGAGKDGELGSGPNSVFQSAPTAVSSTQTFVSITAGAQHSCALTTAGVAYCWGSNQSGQLGIGSDVTTGQYIPVLVSGSRTYVELRAGGDNTCGRTSAGALYCWGFGQYGSLGNGTTTNRIAPTLVSGTTLFAEVSVGGTTTCARSTAGTPYCWGLNSNGTLGLGAGSDSTGNRFVPTLVSGGHAFDRIVTGSSHSCGLVSASGAAFCWGENYAGEIGDGTTQYRNAPLRINSFAFQDITVGGGGPVSDPGTEGFSVYGHTCGIADGALYCWGDNSRGQLGNGLSGSGANSKTPTPVNAPAANLSNAVQQCAMGVGSCASTSPSSIRSSSTGTSRAPGVRKKPPK